MRHSHKVHESKTIKNIIIKINRFEEPKQTKRNREIAAANERRIGHKLSYDGFEEAI